MKKGQYHGIDGKLYDTPMDDTGKQLESSVAKQIQKSVAAHGKGRGKK